MNRKLLTIMLVAVGWLAGARCYARRAIDPATLMKTPFEQQAALLPVNLRSEFGQAVATMCPAVALERTAVPAPVIRSPLDLIKDAIRLANLDGPSLRYPVPESALRNLQIALSRQGIDLTHYEISAAVDNAQALWRENPNASLLDKAMRDQNSERPTFHGNVAEVAEARARGMVPTKNTQGEHYDLTEPRNGPGNAQLKIYTDQVQGLNAMKSDFDYPPKKASRNGIMPIVSLLKLVLRGLLIRKTSGGMEFFILKEDQRITLMPWKAFASTDEAIKYTKLGKSLVGGMAEAAPAEEGLLAGTVEGGFEGGALAGTAWLPQAMESGGKVLGVFGAAARVGYWGYTIYEWKEGKISTRRLVSSSAATVGGLAGGFAGAWAGGEAGAAIGSIFPGPGNAIGGFAGAVIGGIVGGFGGSAAAGYAASSFYQFEDNKFGRRQQAELMQFLTQYYSRPGAARNR